MAKTFVVCSKSYFPINLSVVMNWFHPVKGNYNRLWFEWKLYFYRPALYNQGNQSEGQISDTIIAGVEIFQLLTETRKATDLKSV